MVDGHNRFGLIYEFEQNSLETLNIRILLLQFMVQKSQMAERPGTPPPSLGSWPSNTKLFQIKEDKLQEHDPYQEARGSLNGN